MWYNGLALEVFGRRLWLASIGVVVLRDGEVLHLGHMRCVRTVGYSKLLEELKLLMTTRRTGTKNPQGQDITWWMLPEMRAVYERHRLCRRHGSAWFTWHTTQCQPQLELNKRPRCPELWAAEHPPPVLGFELLEGHTHHLQVALTFPAGYKKPRAQEVQCYLRPLYHTTAWHPTPQWVALPPEHTHCHRQVDDGGTEVMVLAWHGPPQNPAPQQLACPPYHALHRVVQPDALPTPYCVIQHMEWARYWMGVFG